METAMWDRIVRILAGAPTRQIGLLLNAGQH